MTLSSWKCLVDKENEYLCNIKINIFSLNMIY